jgi:hypothetical protein
MIITGDGKVGIGATSPPHQKLTLTGVSGAASSIFDSGILAITTGTGVIADTKLIVGIVDDDYAWMQAGDYGVAYRDIALNPLGGNVGIGTTSPASPLHINADDIAIRLDGTGNTSRKIFFRSTTNANKAEIYADGGLKIWTDDAGSDLLLAPAGDLLMATMPTVVIDDATEYSTTEASELNPVGTDALYLHNEENSSTNGKVSIHMRSSGGGGAASARMTLKNNRSGGSALGFFMRDNSHTTEQKEKMYLDSDGNLSLTGTAAMVITATPGTTPGNNSAISLGRTDGSSNVQMNTALAVDVAIPGTAGVTVGSTNSATPATRLRSANSSNGHIIIAPKGTEKVRITADGNVGIGDDNPVTRLCVEKNTTITTGFNDISQFLDTTIGVGGSVSLNLGRENSTKNLGKMVFKYAGDNSSSNALNFGFYSADNLVTLLANGNFGIGTQGPTLPLDVSREIASSIGQTSTHTYTNNRNWAMRTNNYGSSNWGGWSLEQSTSQGGTPSVARIGVHLNGNVGINMGGDASTSLTDKNPATALHVGGDITVGSADSVGTGAASAIRFVNDNERSRITSNYASGGGGQMGFWTDTTGGSLLQRAYIKNDGSFNFNGPVKMHSNYWGSNDVMKAYSISGPSTNSLTRTINVNTYWGFLAQGGAFMFMIHGWQSDSATGMVHWHNNGSNTQIITGVYLNEFHTASGLTVSVAKGTGAYDIDITLTSTHSNTHGWYWKVWA